jgi:hypothetical protein
MENANFTCECTLGIDCTQPYWSLENEGITIITAENNDKDKVRFAERGINYTSTSASTTFITIPDRVENNNTLISCAAVLFGGVEFSNPQVKLIIIGESTCNNYYCNSLIILLILFRSPSTS